MAPESESLRALLGGRTGAIDATLPVAAFVVGLVVARAVGVEAVVPVASGVAVVVAALVACLRLAQHRKPRSVLVGLLGVAASAAIAAYTGNAADFFAVQIVGNALSALVWAVSIVVRWPLLGLVVGGVLGQRTRWRRDPDLVRGYQRASWVWVAQYVVRLVVLVPLYLADQVVLLGIARIVLTWPLVAACVALSWPLLRSALPAGHPGVRHPVGTVTTGECPH